MYFEATTIKLNEAYGIPFSMLIDSRCEEQQWKHTIRSTIVDLAKTMLRVRLPARHNNRRPGLAHAPYQPNPIFFSSLEHVQTALLVVLDWPGLISDHAVHFGFLVIKKALTLTLTLLLILTRTQRFQLRVSTSCPFYICRRPPRTDS